MNCPHSEKWLNGKPKEEKKRETNDRSGKVRKKLRFELSEFFLGKAVRVSEKKKPVSSKNRSKKEKNIKTTRRFGVTAP